MQGNEFTYYNCRIINCHNLLGEKYAYILTQYVKNVDKGKKTVVNYRYSIVKKKIEKFTL